MPVSWRSRRILGLLGFLWFSAAVVAISSFSQRFPLDVLAWSPLRAQVDARTLPSKHIVFSAIVFTGVFIGACVSRETPLLWPCSERRLSPLPPLSVIRVAVRMLLTVHAKAQKG